MAYGLKYILRYETDLTKSDFQIFIYEDLWTGGVSYKKIGASHVRLSKSRDKKICGTSLEFSIQADTNFEYTNFFSGNNKRHKVELYFGPPATAQLSWTGYIVSDQYSEAYVAPPYDVEVMCTDGLGLLKTEDFELTGMQSRFDAIRYILDKISFDFGYYINVDLFEASMSPTNHNMLAQLHYQAEIHAGKNCYDVLQALLPDDTTIVQANNRWLIERAADRGKTRYKYNADGTGELAETTFDILQLGTIATGDVFPIGSLTMDFTPAWKNFTIKQTYGKRESLLRNSNFEAGTDYWTENGATGIMKVVNMDAGSYAIITGLDPSLSKSISQSIELNSWSPIVFEIKYAPIGYYRRTGSTVISVFLVDIYFKIVLSGTTSGANWYFTDAGWLPESAAADNKYIKIKNCETSQFYDDMKLQETKITGSKLPEDGTLTVYIYQTRYFDRPGYYYSGLAIKSVKIYSQDLMLFSDKEETKVNITENATLEGDTIDLLPCDLPDYQYAELFFDNGNYILDGTNYVPAKLWGTSEVRYINYLASYMANQYAAPKTVLKGQISGFLTGFDRIIQHALNNNKKFHTVTGTWNIIEETMDVELEEIIEFDEVITIETPEEFNPRTEYDRHPELEGFVSIDPAIDLEWVRASEGSYNHTLPGTNVPVVVYKKNSLAPYQLDYDAGTPQFSLKSALITPNSGGNVNAMHIDDGTIISHNFNAKTRAEIDFIKNDTDDYDPTREWSIAADTITLPTNNAHFIYAKVPIDEAITTAEIIVSEDHIEPRQIDDYITFKLGAISPTDGASLREMALLWGNASANTTGYTLPTATATILGGVKIGSGLSIDANGVLSATAGSYTLPIATDTILGGVKLGTGINGDSSGLIWVETNYQAPLNGTGFVKISGTTISYDNSTYDNYSGWMLGTGTTYRKVQKEHYVNFTAGTNISITDNDINGDFTTPRRITISATAYTLPTASASVLGGIKVGSGLSIDGSGVLSASAGTNYWTYSGGLLYPNTYSTDKLLIGTNSDAGAYLLQVTGKSYLTENSSGNTLSVIQGSTGAAIYGSATSGKGVNGNATSGRGLYGYAESGTPCELMSFSTSNNTFKDILILTKSLSSGSASANNAASILFQVYDGSASYTEAGRIISAYSTVTAGSQTSKLIFQTRIAGGSLSSVFEISNSGIGYTTGVGSTATQGTSKATAVTCNALCGQITTFSAALAAAAEATFVVNNNKVSANDIIIVNHVSGGTSGAYLVSVTAVAAGSFTITYSNVSTASKTEAPVFGFAIIKAVIS